ncbi:alpha/beta hydrolase [Neptunomonas antarctica]|uniref:Acetyl esterase/lipase n=1 Tax=Neptunomonas antarctica TaxID=619304 RepID=A0A1N7MXN4_9GAMM|nr:alpha/beta hydrolase [Neptunomonas antarctica]SIS90914.1 Acetyl esterase/lipase [Neptunomonas antarctica]
MSIASFLPVIIIFFLLWVFTRFYLRGENLSSYDQAAGSLMRPLDTEPSKAHFDAVDMFNEMQSNRPRGSFTKLIPAMRASAEQWSEGVSLDGIRIQAVDVGGVPAEWILAEDADPKRRLLYIHGGAFILGSPNSHRSITTRLARSQGMSVLAIDYRLLPEHKRLDCLADCQTAYRWILDNGPDGPGQVKTLFVAGDSAGGNLVLAVIAWARNEGLKMANGAIALSPAADGTCSSPSLRANLSTDPMLGPDFGKLMTMPNWLFLWFAFFSNRLRPCDPRLSPVHGDLSNLPPILIHASEAEMLLDDSRRYVNKAISSGTDASLETWPHMIHVWHLFHDKMPEAQEAFHHIEKFMALNSPSNC